LYSWGDANFGVLGHGELQEGDPQIQTTPKLIEYLSRVLRKKVTHVACGAYHTLCTTGSLPYYTFLSPSITFNLSLHAHLC
jgi:hypothetical protein